MIKRLLFILTALLTSVTSMAAPTHLAVPGGIYLLELGNIDKQPRPQVFFNDKRVMVDRNGPNWLAIIGIPLTSSPGEHTVKVKQGNKTISKNITIEDKAYETQHITVKNKRHVTPNEEDLKRIRSEKAEIVAALATWRELEKPALSLNLPVEGRLSSPFGLKRFFNEQPRKPHSGIDIAAPKGTPILAPADGLIAETGNYFFNGNTVFIDHGQGLVTMYCHMDIITVKPGEYVKNGQQIGTIGSTGRATGPHLHWGVSLNDARIDPMLITPALARKNK